MRKFGWLSLMLSVGFAVGCGDSTGNPTPTDDAPAVTDTPVVTDTQTPTDVRDSGPDVRTDTGPVDAGTSRAGAACTMPDPMGGMDPACGDGDLVCVATQSTPICTNVCENNASQAMERAACGGNGSTCLTVGDGATAQSLCAASCRPAGTTAATGACRAGFVCTGWWFTHAMGTPDSTGCYGFCDADSQCGTGMRCNARTGDCGATGVDTTRLPDGAPCNPRTTVMVPGEAQPRNIQCRGICFRTDNDATHGICGSLMNTRASTMCPDDPDNVAPRAPQGNTDNLAVCIWRGCTSNADCRSPHICRYPEGADMMPITELDPTCDYPTTAQRTGIVGDGGAPTDAATDAPTDRPATDVPATDVPATDVPATDVGTDSATVPTDAGTDAATATDGGAAG